MQAAVAEAVARSTREQAVADARHDIQELRRRAVEAGRDRSRKVIKTSRIDTRTGEIRYNPAGRHLRDWYLHVYLNTLRANLGEPAVTIDSQQVEDTTAQLRRIRPAADGLNALQAAGVVRDVAVDDAAHAAADIVAHLGGVAARRAILHATDDRFDGDQLSVHVSRHWYQRCYDDHVHGATRSRQPLAEVTGAEMHEVALVLESGRPCRLIGSDGVPLMTPHGTALAELDRRLAAGALGLISPASEASHHTDPMEVLRTRVVRTWKNLHIDRQSQWLRLAGADPASIGRPWQELSGDDQTRVARLYLDTHQPAQLALLFRGDVIDEKPHRAAMTMFSHRTLLETRTADGRNDAAPQLSTAVGADAPVAQELSTRLRSQ